MARLPLPSPGPSEECDCPEGLCQDCTVSLDLYLMACAACADQPDGPGRPGSHARPETADATPPPHPSG